MRVQHNSATPANEFEHFIVCPVCKEAMDCSDLSEVVRHADPRHERPAS